jgi:threonine dehydrogenase-like Zn-dependent dehydrogenase
LPACAQFVCNGSGDISVQDVPDAKIEQPADVIVKITAR